MKILGMSERWPAKCETPLHLRSVVAESWDDAARSLRLHAPTQCTVGRLLHGLLITNRYIARHPGANVIIQSAHGEKVVAVELDYGDEICFSFHHLIGFSATIEFRTILDWAISSWAIGRPVLSIAKGPGQIFFRCAGSPAIWDEQQRLPSSQRVQSSRLVLWPTNAVFRTDSLESIWDIWMGEIRVFMQCQANAPHVVMDVEQQSNDHHRLWDLIVRLYRFW